MRTGNTQKHCYGFAKRKAVEYAILLPRHGAMCAESGKLYKEGMERHNGQTASKEHCRSQPSVAYSENFTNTRHYESHIGRSWLYTRK